MEGQPDEVSLEAFVDESYSQYEHAQRELKEIEVLIKQSAAEVERLAQRNAQATTYLRQLETNFETVPREDIRDAYESLQNAQQRLFTMRGQLEKLQSDRRNLERLLGFQRGFLEIADGLTSLPAKRSRPHADQSSIIRIVQLEESARQSLVRKMHDGPASSLSNFILQAEICQRFFDMQPDRARAELNALKGTAATTFESVKDFIFELRPMMLDDLGVAPTLRRYVETLQEKDESEIVITVTGMERRLEGYVEVTVFRAVQELVNNARRHAQASEIQILLDIGENEIVAVVEDNGRGFDAEELLNGEQSRTIGISTIRQRLEMLEGDLEIMSSPGQGTRAQFSIPLHSEGVAHDVIA